MLRSVTSVTYSLYTVHKYVAHRPYRNYMWHSLILPFIKIMSDVFPGNFNEFLVNVQANYSRGIVVLGDVESYMSWEIQLLIREREENVTLVILTYIAADVQNFFIIKPASLEELESHVFNISRIPK